MHEQMQAGCRLCNRMYGVNFAYMYYVLFDAERLEREIVFDNCLYPSSSLVVDARGLSAFQ